MSDTIPVLNVEYGSAVVGDTFDIILSEEIKKSNLRESSPGVIILNFSDVRFIDVVSCIYIISFAKMCRKTHWYLTFKVPEHQSVIDFWKIWGFYRSFEEAVGIPFSKFVSEKDQNRINGPQITFSDYVTTIDSPAGRLRSKAVFGFNVEKIGKSKSPNLADQITNEWRRREVQDALHHHFGKRKEYIPPRIIFETIYNSTKHAEANVLLTTSFSGPLCKTKPGKKWAREELFTLAIWDDGKSLLSTLHQAIKKGVPVREDLPIPFEQEYLLNCHELYKPTRYFQERIPQDIELKPELSLELLLIATLFPGTTSKPASLHESRIFDDETLTKRGLGLYTLLNTAIDVLGGTVSFRTSRFFMHVRKPNRRDLTEHNISIEDFECAPEKYKKVKVVKTPNNLPEFFGNLVVIRA